MRLALGVVLLLVNALAWASGSDAHGNCDVNTTSTGCEVQGDGKFAPFDEADTLGIDLQRVPAERVLGCSDETDAAKRPRDALSADQIALLDGHAATEGVLIDATINDVRHIFVSKATDPMRWDANPDRVTLVLPGETEPTVALVDVAQGPTRYCMQSRVLVVHAKANRAASIQILSTPATQEVAVGGTAIFQIKIINNGTTVLAPVNVAASLVSTCNRSISSLGAGFTYTYSCNKPSVQTPFSNTVTATGQQAGDTVSATATSLVTLPGGGSGSSSTALFFVYRLPWVQYAKPGESARWQFKVTNMAPTALSNVSINETVATQCNKALATVAIGQTVVWECAQSIAAGPPIRTFTFSASSQQANGSIAREWEFTNVVITDYIHVGGFDGCVANGTSSELCTVEDWATPQMRRAVP